MNVLYHSGTMAPNLNFPKKVCIPFLVVRGEIEIYIKYEKYTYF